MRDLKKITLIIVMGVIAALSLLGLWWSFFGSKSGMGVEFDPITVEAETVRRGSIVRRVTVVGTLRADNEVIIKPEIEGKIKKFNFEGGNIVQKGDPLVEIEDDVFKVQVKEAKATLAFADADYSRYERLAQQSAGPAKMKEKALAEKLQAESRLELAEIKLENTIIRAPFTGVLGLKQFSVGSFINPQTELLSLVDVDPIKLDFRLPAVYLQSISRGQEVKVTIDSMPDEIFRAKIDAIDPKVDSTANSVLVRAVIPNPNALLKPGLFARVNLVVGSKDNTLLIPEVAVLSRIDEEFVYRVVEVPINGVQTTVVVKVPVTTGLSESGVIEVSRGLNEGDQVVTVGLSKVRDRYPVRVVEDAEAEEEVDEENQEALDEENEQKPSDDGKEAAKDEDKNASVEEKISKPAQESPDTAKESQPSSDQQVAEKPANDQTSPEKQNTEQPAVEAPSNEKPAVDSSADETSSAEKPSAETSSADTDINSNDNTSSENQPLTDEKLSTEKTNTEDTKAAEPPSVDKNDSGKSANETPAEKTVDSGKESE